MTAANPTPTTELEAINSMLALISMAPLNTLEGLSTADVAAAKRKLSDVSVSIQSKGWWFNTESDYPLNRNVSNEISLAPTIVNVDLDTTQYSSVDVVQRGTRLYDRKNHTYIFSINLLADVTILLPFEELPQVARKYISVLAGREFANDTIGDVERDGFSERDVFSALVALEAKDGENSDYSIFDNYDVARVIDRRSS